MNASHCALPTWTGSLGHHQHHVVGHRVGDRIAVEGIITRLETLADRVKRLNFLFG